jgi:hypothetical protein
MLKDVEWQTENRPRVSKSDLQRSIFVPGIWTSFTSPLNISAS